MVRGTASRSSFGRRATWTAPRVVTAVLNRGPNKRQLQAMSMLFRSLAKSKAAPGTDEQKNYIAESMVYAKAAVKLDLTDGYSWYQVGTAYMSAFFAEEPLTERVAQALKAYENAERGGPNGIGRSKGLRSRRSSRFAL